MKLATFMMPLHPPGRQPAETLAEDREAILLADKLGLRGGASSANTSPTSRRTSPPA